MQQVLSTGVVYRPLEGDAPRARMSLACRENDPSATVRNMLALAHRLRGVGLHKAPRRTRRGD